MQKQKHICSIESTSVLTGSLLTLPSSVSIFAPGSSFFTIVPKASWTAATPARRSGDSVARLKDVKVKDIAEKIKNAFLPLGSQSSKVGVWKSVY